MKLTITKDEIEFCEYKLGIKGKFKHALYDLYWLADTKNKMKLIGAFPVLIIAQKYNDIPDYWQDLVKKWNSKYPRTNLRQ